MQKSEQTVAPEVIQDKDQGSWHVHVKLSSGAPMDITGFKTEPAAKAWIKNEYATWLKDLVSGKHSDDPQTHTRLQPMGERHGRYRR